MHSLIRSVTQTLCDDLARAEKAEDGKKKKKCDFQGPIATLSHGPSKTEENCNFKVSSKCLRVKASVCKSVCA